MENIFVKTGLWIPLYTELCLSQCGIQHSVTYPHCDRVERHHLVFQVHCCLQGKQKLILNPASRDICYCGQAGTP